jgi:hypothetical protein
MSILESLGFKSQAPATSGTPSNAPVPNVLGGQQAPVTQATPQMPAGGPSLADIQASMQQGQQTPAAPVDQFANLWENDPNSAPPAGLNFNINPEQLAEISNKLDFAALVPLDIQQRIMSGGEDAMKAMMESNNIISRAVYQQNAMATTKLVELAAKDAESRIAASLESKFKLMGLKDHQATTNPALQDPSLRPIVDSVQQQIVRKFPNANSREIQEMTDRYFNSIATKLAPGLGQQQPAPNMQQRATSQQETDWATYLFS